MVVFIPRLYSSDWLVPFLGPVSFDWVYGSGTAPIPHVRLGRVTLALVTADATSQDEFDPGVLSSHTPASDRQDARSEPALKIRVAASCSLPGRRKILKMQREKFSCGVRAGRDGGEG